MNLIWRFIKNEEGQTSTEYILLLAVVALIVFRFKDTAMTRLTDLINGVFNKADTMVEDLNSSN